MAYTWRGWDNYGAAYQRYATTLGSEMQAGFKVNMKPQPYTTTFFPTVGKGRGNFEGFGIQGGTSQGSPQEMLRSYYRDFEWPLPPGCEIDPGEGLCPDDQQVEYDNYPDALRAFLIDLGYIPR